MKLIATLLLLFPLLAAGEINFITLKHRNAESLIPLLQPVVDEGVRLSGKGPTLIVNSLPWQMIEVRTLVQQLDTPLQSLLISVAQGGDAQQSTLHGDASGTLQQPAVRLYGTRQDEQTAISQQLRVIEGAWATIRSGQSVPLPSVTTRQSAHGTTFQQSIEYREIDSGFEVRPYLNGEQVTLEVRPFRAKQAFTGGGVIEHQEISTTVSGKLGEWLTLGGIDEQQQRAGVGTVYGTGSKRDTTHNVKIRVERLNH